MKKSFVKILLILILVIIAFGICNCCHADSIDNIYNLNSNEDSIVNAGMIIVKYIIYAGVIVSVIVLMIKGIKYIIAAPEGKAEIKKEIVPWFIGVVLLFSIQVILQAIINFSIENINNLNNI
ncbi:MAG: hypothetical protein E7313_04030 [Clostridiales bacterium]|nr:hypothetical protein [Clostridiales bacterium]